jgi:hypothetical protein
MRYRPAALLLLSTIPGVLTCSSEADCTLNGVCANSTCLCDAGWGGHNCSSLLLGITDPTLGHPWGAGSSSWGGLPVYDPLNGTWHLFYSQIDRGCGLGQWSKNSRVVHAVANNPLGPFEDSDVVQPAFSHNAQAFRAPDGTWVVFYIGCAQGESVVNCSASPADSLPLAPRTVPPGRPGQNPSALCSPQPFGALGETYISYSWAPTPYGPWTPLGRPAISGGFNRSTWHPWITNPAPWVVQDDGSVLLAVSGDGGASGKCVGFARADSWNGTYTIEESAGGDPGRAPIPGGEDPFVWVNTRGHRHVIWHDVSGRSNGGHAFAPADDPTAWVVATHELYNGTVTFPNGTSGVCNDRERPKLLFDDTSSLVPLALFNGIIPPGVVGDGPCFTGVTRLTV